MVLDLGKVVGGPRSILRDFSIVGAIFVCHLAAGRLGEAYLSGGLQETPASVYLDMLCFLLLN